MDIKPPKAWRSQRQPSMPNGLEGVSQLPNRLATSETTSTPSKVEVGSVAQEGLSTPTNSVIPEANVDSGSSKDNKSHRKPSKKKKALSVIVLAFLFLVGFVLGVGYWLAGPLDDNASPRSFVVKSGESPSIIGSHLEQQKFIRSQLAFTIYVRATGANSKLRAGTYRLSSNQSMKDIVEHLLKGNDEVYNVTIPPGLTLKQLADPAVKNSFAEQGFSDTEIQQAFAATYQSPLLVGRPDGATLEGYIYPETFQIRNGDSLNVVIEKSLAEMYKKIENDKLLDKFAEKGLSLHQAVILASIVQEETSVPSVQAQVAQVFLKRLGIGMSLGSDVTFVYAANQLGVPAVPGLDSPYNTRIHAGLPPGPIANFNYSALKAVADPASGDFLYFVAGDDGQVHFANTNEEHEANTARYCGRCSQPIPSP